MKKRSIFWQKPWTNPFAKCRFFLSLWKLHFWGPKSFMFYPEYQKMFFSGFFFLKKKHLRNRSIFWEKPWTNPVAQCRFFFTLQEFHFLGLKSVLYYPELKKCFFLAFLAKRKHIRRRSNFCQKPWTNPFAKCPSFWLC